MHRTTGWQGTVEMVRRAGTRKGREKSGRFSIEGIRLHERALRAGVSVERAIVTARLLNDSTPRVQTLLSDLRENGCLIEEIPVAVMKDLIGERDLGQILGLIQMPEQQALEEIVGQNKHPLLLAAVDVKDPGNVGAMVRTAHAVGATGFVATGISDPYHPKALRTTMGSLFRLPVFYVEDSLSLITQLRKLGIEVVGTAVGGDVPLPQAKFAHAGTAVLMGSEAWGLGDEVLAAVDWLVSIPMKGGVDSLSVNAAAAIVLYEIGRQQGTIK